MSISSWSTFNCKYVAFLSLICLRDSFYIYSDGFPDQFGGERGKKYLTKKFRSFLQQISTKSMQEQKQILAAEFEAWKGEESQVDDVLVIGFRL